jgi:hypothetical protein
MYKLLRQYDQEQQGGNSLEEGKAAKDAAPGSDPFQEVRCLQLQTVGCNPLCLWFVRDG